MFIKDNIFGDEQFTTRRETFVLLVKGRIAKNNTFMSSKIKFLFVVSSKTRKTSTIKVFKKRK